MACVVWLLQFSCMFYCIRLRNVNGLCSQRVPNLVCRAAKHFFNLVQQLQHTTHLDQPNPHFPSCSPPLLMSSYSQSTQGDWPWQAKRQGAQRLVHSAKWSSDQTVSAPSGFWQPSSHYQKDTCLRTWTIVESQEWTYKFRFSLFAHNKMSILFDYCK